MYVCMYVISKCMYVCICARMDGWIMWTGSASLPNALDAIFSLIFSVAGKEPCGVYVFSAEVIAKWTCQYVYIRMSKCTYVQTNICIRYISCVSLCNDFKWRGKFPSIDLLSSLLLQSIQNKLWGAILVLTFMSEWEGFVRCYKARILPCVHKEAVWMVAMVSPFQAVSINSSIISLTLIGCVWNRV